MLRLYQINHETTANIGTFNAEGATNIVSPEVTFVAEARSLNNEKLNAQIDHMVKCLLDAAEKYGAKVEYNVEVSYYSFTLDNHNELVKLVEDRCKKLGLEVTKAPTGGGSDANIYNRNGICAVNLANGTELVHTTDERLKIDEFEKITKLVLELMIN